jgi:hypothetical protein
MNIFFSTFNLNKTFQLILLIFALFYLNSCGLYRPVDARQIPPNAEARVKQNQEQGKGISFGRLGKKKGGDFQFASSNEMWRATISILDFVPLSNVDYGGGIIVTDWYKNTSTDKDSIKLMIQFLSNEIRADGLKVSIYKKVCLSENNCTTNLLDSTLNSEIKLAILKKAALLKKRDLELRK